MKKIILAIFAIFALFSVNLVSADVNKENFETIIYSGYNKYSYLNENWRFNKENIIKSSENFWIELRKKYWNELWEKIIDRIIEKVENIDEKTSLSLSNKLNSIIKTYTWEHKIVFEALKHVTDTNLFIKYGIDFNNIEFLENKEANTRLFFNFPIKTGDIKNIPNGFEIKWINEKIKLYYATEAYPENIQNLNWTISNYIKFMEENKKIYSNIKKETLNFKNKKVTKISFYNKENKSYYENYYVLEDLRWSWVLQLSYTNPNNVTKSDREKINFIVETASFYGN